MNEGRTENPFDKEARLIESYNDMKGTLDETITALNNAEQTIAESELFLRRMLSESGSQKTGPAYERIRDNLEQIKANTDTLLRNKLAIEAYLKKILGDMHEHRPIS